MNIMPFVTGLACSMSATWDGSTVAGDQAEAFLQWVSTNDVRRLAVGHAQYSMVCQESGGILDDIFIYKTGQAEFLVCVNASNRIKILEWFQGQSAKRNFHKPAFEINRKS